MSKQNPCVQMSRSLLDFIRQLGLPWSNLRVLIGLLALEIRISEHESGGPVASASRLIRLQVVKKWAGLERARDNRAIKAALPALTASGLFSEVSIVGDVMVWQLSPLASHLIEQKFHRYSLLEMGRVNAIRSATTFYVYADVVRVYRSKAPSFDYTFGEGVADVCRSWPVIRPKLIRALKEVGPHFNARFLVVLRRDPIKRRVDKVTIRIGHPKANWFRNAYTCVPLGWQWFEVIPSQGEVTKLRLSTGE